MFDPICNPYIWWGPGLVDTVKIVPRGDKRRDDPIGRGRIVP